MYHYQEFNACYRNATNREYAASYDIWKLLHEHCPELLLQAHILEHNKRGFIEPNATNFE